jgi:hypothetical protein
MNEQDWMLFNECLEQEQQKTPVRILSVDEFAERYEKSKFNLSYSLYYRMRVLQGCDDEHHQYIYVFEDGETWSGEIPSKYRLTDEEYDVLGEPRKQDWYGFVEEEVLADVSMEQLKEIIKLVPDESKDKLKSILKTSNDFSGKNYGF